jgi:Rieske Fe-S protein
MSAPGRPSEPEPPGPQPESAGPGRRPFLAASAVGVACAAALTPLLSAVAALLDPLRASESQGEWVRVTRLDALPSGGTPKRFTVATGRSDGWTTYHETPVGAVYLRRTDTGVAALNVVCPHAGCFVGLADDASRFACPCHRSSFDLTGRINDPASPSPRDMDGLPVELRGEEVWVRFQNFLPGRSDKTGV